MRFVLIGGNTDTARIDGISAAGASPDAMLHTPSADLETVEYGRPVGAPVVPVSPSGCPTPAVVTRAVRELLDFDVLAVDAGLARPTAAPTIVLGDDVGSDIRTPRPVEAASDTFDAARRLGRSLPEDELVIGEAIAGGTTTALGVLTALGEHPSVSSSLPENPLSLATTSFIAEDETAAIRELTNDLDLELTVTDPGFDRSSHPAMDAYVAGEAKEGVGMGGALALADAAELPMDAVRERIVTVYDRLVADGAAVPS
ncbi:MAG: TIGR00303 family protein [Haloarculaceae archaeon]